MTLYETTKGTTRADDDTTKPSVTAPGDGPADTLDTNQRVTSASFDNASPEAIRSGTVNAVRPLSPAPAPAPIENPRIERYQTPGPDGQPVTVEHNIDTGETRIV